MKYGDDQFAPFGQRSIRFGRGRDVYCVAVDETDQNKVEVQTEGATISWHIEAKQFANDVFSLSGLTAGSGGPHPEDVYWYELILSKPAVIRYWANQVMAHEDREIPAPV
jgi:hypothetical protein